MKRFACGLIVLIFLVFACNVVFAEEPRMPEFDFGYPGIQEGKFFIAEKIIEKQKEDNKVINLQISFYPEDKGGEGDGYLVYDCNRSKLFFLPEGKKMNLYKVDKLNYDILIVRYFEVERDGGMIAVLGEQKQLTINGKTKKYGWSNLSEYNIQKKKIVSFFNLQDAPRLEIINDSFFITTTPLDPQMPINSLDAIKVSYYKIDEFLGFPHYTYAYWEYHYEQPAQLSFNEGVDMFSASGLIIDHANERVFKSKKLENIRVIK
jgi:hypothetical protein